MEKRQDVSVLICVTLATINHYNNASFVNFHLCLAYACPHTFISKVMLKKHCILSDQNSCEI